MALSATVSASCASLRAVQQRRAPAARASVRVCAQQQVAREQPVDLKVLAAGVAAAALVFAASPAEAGVVLQQPEVKKVFQGGATTSAPAASSPAAPAAKKSSSSEGVEFGFDLRGFILPASLGGILGGAFALNALDPEFISGTVKGSFDRKDSNIIGAGYEPVLKTEGGIAVGKGTKKVAAKKFFGKK